MRELGSLFDRPFGGTLTIGRSRGGGAAFVGPYDNTPSIVAAYGMRRLRSAYTGSLLRLRRSSDNAEQDFGYDANGDLDTAAIATFVGAGSGFVTTWYDQSGNGRNATQATAARQPLYVASGQNSRPVMRFDGSNDWLDIATMLGNSAGAALSIISVSKQFAGTSGAVLSTRPAGLPQGWVLRYNSMTQATYLHTGQTPVLTHTVPASMHLLEIIRSGLSVQIGHNGTLDSAVSISDYTVSTDTATRIGVSQGGAIEFLNGDIAELVIANAAWSTVDRQAAESAANSYWAVY